MDTTSANPFQTNVKRGVLFGFVPHRLEIEGRSELNIFPFNVMFARYKVENGKIIMGNAIYEPDLGSFKQDGNVSSMEYHNAYGGNSQLVIEYDKLKKSYHGIKIVNGKSVGEAGGPEWYMFFVRFTALGLSLGEKCEFEEILPQG